MALPEQPAGLLFRCPDGDGGGQPGLVATGGDRGVGGLVGSMPMMTFIGTPWLVGLEPPVHS